MGACQNMSVGIEDSAHYLGLRKFIWVKLVVIKDYESAFDAV